MSLGALCTAVKDRIVHADVLNLTNTRNLECDVTFDGRPKPASGEQFVAVWPGYWNAISMSAEYFEEEFGVNVTLTRRLGQAPQDQWANDVWLKAATGIEAVARKIIAAIHGDYDNVFAAWNNNTGEVEPLLLKSVSVPQLRDALWFSGNFAQAGSQYAGVAVDLQFGGAKRIQNVDGPMT